MLNGDTRIIAHVGYPTTTFKSPMIYNPWFDKRGINAAVVPLGVKAEDFVRAFPEICRFTNFHGALITMPHKIAVISLIDDASTAVKVAGSCNAVRRDDDGRLVGDMFDGEGFVRGAARRGRSLKGGKVLVVGSGGVGSAIAASSAAAGAAQIALYDVSQAAMEALASRLGRNYPKLKVTTGSNDPDGFNVVINATPLGHEVRRSDARRRLAPFAFDLCRRSGDEAGDHRLSRRGAGERLRDPIRDRYAVRADPRLPRILRLSVGRSFGAESSRQG